MYITSYVKYVNKTNWHSISIYACLYIEAYILNNHLYHFLNQSISLKPIINTKIHAWNSNGLLLSHMFLITISIHRTDSRRCISRIDLFWFFFHSNFWPECNKFSHYIFWLEIDTNLFSNRSKHYWHIKTKIDHGYLNFTQEFTQSALTRFHKFQNISYLLQRV